MSDPYSPATPPPAPTLPPWPVPRPAPDIEGAPLRTDAEIQGNVLAGFNKDHQVLLFVRFPDSADADQTQTRAWLKRLLPRIATNAAVAGFNKRFSQARRASGSDPESLTAVWFNLSLTGAGFRLLAPTAVSELEARPDLDEGIKLWLAGAAAAADAVGDSDEGSQPTSWLFGSSTEDVHAIICIQADRAEDLETEVDWHRRQAAKRQLTIVFEQVGHTQPGAAAGHEHFGFKDGISQPGVLGFDAVVKVDDGWQVQGKPGTDAISAGTFVLGYPRGDDGSAVNVPAWMFDGSFLVTRRLSQDVPGFWAGVEQQHAAFSQQAGDTSPSVIDPTTGIPSADALAAKLVGRWRSGTPTDHAPVSDNRSSQDPERDNNFDFADDQDGARTPACAHIRKVYPRSGANGVISEADTRVHRILRRGIPFGATFDPSSGRGHGVDTPRGLVFQCYQSSLHDQFVFLQQTWVNTPSFPVAETGNDPVIGRRGNVSIGAGGATHSLSFEQFVFTEGSAFSLTPSLSTLRTLASGGELSFG